jgi:hypothetical protein
MNKFKDMTPYLMSEERTTTRVKMEFIGLE